MSVEIFKEKSDFKFVKFFWNWRKKIRVNNLVQNLWSFLRSLLVQMKMKGCCWRKKIRCMEIKGESKKKMFCQNEKCWTFTHIWPFYCQKAIIEFFFGTPWNTEYIVQIFGRIFGKMSCIRPDIRFNIRILLDIQHIWYPVHPYNL